MTLDLRTAADVLWISVRHLQRLVAWGRTPQPLKLGKRRVAFLTDEFYAWLSAGMPRRGEWERLWAGREALKVRCPCGRRISQRLLWRCVAEAAKVGVLGNTEENETEPWHVEEPP